jgi:hypothetical protein
LPITRCPMDITLTSYPEKTCTVEHLVRQKKLVDATLAGTKTKQPRDGVYGYPGEPFMPRIAVFEIVSLTHDRLGDMTDEEAGARSDRLHMGTYRVILRMHIRG